MGKKIILQLFLLIFVLLMIFLLYSKYFKSENNSVILDKTGTEEIIEGNQIKNIKYESSDDEGRKYLIMLRLGD